MSPELRLVLLLVGAIVLVSLVSGTCAAVLAVCLSIAVLAAFAQAVFGDTIEAYVLDGRTE